MNIFDQLSETPAERNALVTCPHCSGEGAVLATDGGYRTCMTCRGRGVVKRATEKLDAIAAATGFDFRRDYRQPKKWIDALRFLIDDRFDERFTARGLADLRKSCAGMVESIDRIPLQAAEVGRDE